MAVDAFTFIKSNRNGFLHTSLILVKKTQENIRSTYYFFYCRGTWALHTQTRVLLSGVHCRACGLETRSVPESSILKIYLTMRVPSIQILLYILVWKFRRCCGFRLHFRIHPGTNYYYYPAILASPYVVYVTCAQKHALAKRFGHNTSKPQQRATLSPHDDAAVRTFSCRRICG